MATVASFGTAALSNHRWVSSPRDFWNHESDPAGRHIDSDEPGRSLRQKWRQDFGRFVRIAMGSASEVDYPMLLVSDLGYLRPEDHTELSAQLNEIRRMSTGLDKRLHRRFRNRVGDRTLTAKS